MYISIGTRTYCYAIRLQRGRVRDRRRDPYIFIGMTGDKRLRSFLEYFQNDVTCNDSITHQAVSDRVNAFGRFYVTLVDRFIFSPRSRSRVEFYQRKYRVEIPYP